MPQFQQPHLLGIKMAYWAVLHLLQHQIMALASSNSAIFNATQPSTIVAYAQIPSSTNFNGIFGYSSNTSASATNGFGFNNGTGNNFRDDLAGQVISNNNVGYNFVGRALSGSNNVVDTNGTQTLPSTNATALGGGNFYFR